MHVTRKRTGYTIRCTDGDFAALQALTSGATPTGMAKGAVTRRTAGGELLRVDADRR